MSKYGKSVSILLSKNTASGLATCGLSREIILAGSMVMRLINANTAGKSGVSHQNYEGKKYIGGETRILRTVHPNPIL